MKPAIPPVSGNNDAIERLSSAKHFPTKNLLEGPSLCAQKMPYLLQESKQTKSNLKNFVYMRLLLK